MILNTFKATDSEMRHAVSELVKRIDKTAEAEGEINKISQSEYAKKLADWEGKSWFFRLKSKKPQPNLYWPYVFGANADRYDALALEQIAEISGVVTLNLDNPLHRKLATSIANERKEASNG